MTTFARRVRDRWLAFILKGFNPLPLTLARRGSRTFSIVRHVGRKSGRTFEAPVILADAPEGLVAELTYGDDVNWYRNTVKGGTTVLHRGRWYRVTGVEPYATDAGRRAYGPVKGLVLRMLRRHDFRLLRVEPIEATPAGGSRRIAVLGASGGTGRLVVAEALAHGHQVVAISRSGLAIPGATSVSIDVQTASADKLAAALHGVDAVISTLGHRLGEDDTVLAKGARLTVDAMALAGVRRVVAISAGPVGTVASPLRPDPPKHDPGDGPVVGYVLAPIVRLVFGSVYRDSARMEDVLRSSDTEWTIVRPPLLVNRPARRRLRFALDRNVRGGLAIGRADLAAFLVGATGDERLVGHSVGVAG